MEKTYIRFKNFKRLISSQPFFVWNDIKKKESFDYIDENDLSGVYWANVSSEADESNFGEVLARTNMVIENKLRDDLVKNNDSIIISGSTEEAISKTKQSLSSGKLLINPVFEYMGAIAKPFAFDTNSKTIVDLKFSKTTKRIDLIKAYYLCSIIEKNTGIFGYDLFLPNHKNYKKRVIDLIKTSYLNKTVSGKLPGTLSKNGTSTEVNVIDFINAPEFKVGKNFIRLPKIKDAITRINDAKRAILNEAYIHMDVEQLIKNNQFQDMLSKFAYKYAGFNGSVLSSKNIVKNIKGDVSSVSNKVMDTYTNLKDNFISKNNLDSIKRIDNARKIIWYDFEGYSLPFPPLDGIAPHSQVVFQVSIIETYHNVEKGIKNIVIDPKKITLDDLFKIIEATYSGGADEYVVYNKAYENARINEYVKLLIKYNHPRAQEAQNMFVHIDNHTVDLMDLFVIRSGNKLPEIMLYDQKTRYSIKNIEKHISKNNIKLPRPIKQYKNLKVQNGGMAMDIAIQRSLGIIGDEEWKKKEAYLKEYCENDVRAMIMVYDFCKRNYK